MEPVWHEWIKRPHWIFMTEPEIKNHPAWARISMFSLSFCHFLTGGMIIKTSFSQRSPFWFTIIVPGRRAPLSISAHHVRLAHAKNWCRPCRLQVKRLRARGLTRHNRVACIAGDAARNIAHWDKAAPQICVSPDFYPCRLRPAQPLCGL